jgi:hypothetical protein
MSKQPLVYDDTIYREAVEKTKTDPKYPQTVLKLVIPDKVHTSGCVYLRDVWNFSPSHKELGHFLIWSPEGIPIRAIPAPTGTKEDETRNSWGIKLSQSGVFGEFWMNVISPAWHHANSANFTALAAKRKNGQSLTLNEANYNSYDDKVGKIYRDTLSKKNTKNPGGKIEDPLINFKFEKGVFPDKHPYGKKGEPKIEFYDADTKKPKVLGKSFESYERAHIERKSEDGTITKELVNEANAHEFVRAGSRIILQKFVPAMSANPHGITLSNKVWKVVIKPGNGTITADEEPEEEMEADETTPPSVETKVVVDLTKSVADSALNDLVDDI